MRALLGSNAAPLAGKGAPLSDFGIGSHAAALTGQPRRRRREPWGTAFPDRRANIDLDFLTNRGLVFGAGAGGALDTVTRTGYAGGGRITAAGLFEPINLPDLHWEYGTARPLGLRMSRQAANLQYFSGTMDVTHRVSVSGVSGTFSNGETVTATGGGSGVYRSDVSSGTVFAVSTGTGTFSGTLTGGTSGATATIAGVVTCWLPATAGLGTVGVLRNGGTSPDGAATAVRFNLQLNGGTSSGDTASVSGFGTATQAGQPTACSVWLKSATGNTYTMEFTFSGTLPDVDAGATPGLITVTPEWQRYEIRLASAADTSRYFRLGVRGTSGSSTQAIVYAWCGQQDIAAYLPGDIPTTTAQVTRTAASALIGGALWAQCYNADEGTFIRTMSMPDLRPVLVATATHHLSGASDGTSANRVGPRVVSDPSAPTSGLIVNVASANQWSTATGSALVGATSITTVLTYSRAEGYQAIIGPDGAVQTRNITAWPATLSQAVLMGDHAGAATADGFLERWTYIPKALARGALRQAAGL